MKKPIFYFLFLILMLFGCSAGKWHSSHENNTEIANTTFQEILSAKKNNDKSALVDLFSPNTRAQLSSLNTQAELFFEFIEGDIVNYSDAIDRGVAVETHNNHGKKKKEIQSSFLLETDQDTYFIAIMECVQDSEDSNNIGITSIYIISTKNWNSSYVFRGDGNWTLGLNIMMNSSS